MHMHGESKNAALYIITMEPCTCMCIRITQEIGTLLLWLLYMYGILLVGGLHWISTVWWLFQSVVLQEIVPQLLVTY